MGEYTLDSIVAMPISPKSYGKPTSKMKSHESAMTIFDTFVPSSVPLEAKKEEQVVKDWIYRGEEDILLQLQHLSPLYDMVKDIPSFNEWVTKDKDL